METATRQTSEAAAADQPTLAELQRKLDLRREQVVGKTSSSRAPNSRYPGTVDVDCVCTAGCGAEFVVPMVYLASDRPVGKVPDRCSICVEKDDRLEAERIRIEDEERARIERNKNEHSLLEQVELAGGNPYQYCAHTFETFRAQPGREKALAAAREWTETVCGVRDKYAKVRGLYLVGPTGTAKTEIAHCVLKGLLDGGLEPVKGVLYDDSLTLIERIKGTYGSDQNTWDFLAARINARVWILDDFMTERPTDDAVSKIQLLFNRREGKPTLVTSNYTPQVLQERHEDFFRLASRLGTANYRIIGVTGTDGRFDRPALVGR